MEVLINCNHNVFISFYGHDAHSLFIMETEHKVHRFIWKAHRWHLLERRPFGPPSLRKEWSLQWALGYSVCPFSIWRLLYWAVWPLL